MNTRLPGSFYDLTARISEARAIVGCALECVPMSDRPVEYRQVNHLSNLISAVDSILVSSERNLAEMERAMGQLT